MLNGTRIAPIACILLACCEGAPNVDPVEPAELPCTWCQDVDGVFYNYTPPYVSGNLVAYQLDGGEIWIADKCEGLLQSVPHLQGQHADSQRAVGIGNTMLVCGGRSSVCAMDLENRAILWTVPLQGSDNYNRQHCANSTHFFVLDQGGVRCFNSNGEFQYAIELDFVPRTSIATDSYLLCYENDHSAFIWRYAMVDLARRAVLYSQESECMINSALITESGLAIVACTFQVNCYGLGGHRLWQTGNDSATAITHGDGVLAGSSGLDIWVLDENSGQLKWQRPGGSSSLQIEGGALYNASYYIDKYDLETGTLMETVIPPQPVFLRAVIEDSLAFFQSDYGICSLNLNR